MMNAYDKSYLANAQNNLGDMLDYAVCDLGLGLDEFYAYFLVSSVSGRFARGDCRVLAGSSGIELALLVLEECAVPFRYKRANEYTGKTPEYWTGWALAFYQWQTGRSFQEIERDIPITEIRRMYARYHEEDVIKFAQAAQDAAKQRKIHVYLKYYRLLAGMSQRELAQAADIPIRTLQQYEQKQKNINKASAEYVIRLARVLGVRPEELLEAV